MQVAVVILNWNGKQHLETYLPSVLEHSSNAHIILADNASTDDSIAFVKNTYPSIEIIVNSSNGGFAKGYNDALNHVSADWYVLLNSDVEVSSGWIDHILSALKENPSVAAAQPKILAHKRPTHFEHAGAAGGFIDKDFYPFCRGRIFSSAEEDLEQYNKPQQIFWATGACMFVKADLFHEAGGFDNDFFAHMEEIDLCWRLQSMGYEIWCYPSSVVYHLGGGTLNYMSPKKTYLNFRNNLFMIHKNYRGNLFFKIFKRLILDGLAGVKFLFGGQFKHFIAVIKAHLSYYKAFSNLNRKRKLTHQLGNNTIQTIIPKSLIYNYYIKGKKTYKDIIS